MILANGAEVDLVRGAVVGVAQTGLVGQTTSRVEQMITVVLHCGAEDNHSIPNRTGKAWLGETGTEGTERLALATGATTKKAGSLIVFSVNMTGSAKCFQEVHVRPLWLCCGRHEVQV